jgi:hypothetical protein
VCVLARVRRVVSEHASWLRADCHAVWRINKLVATGIVSYRRKGGAGVSALCASTALQPHEASVVCVCPPDGEKQRTRDITPGSTASVEKSVFSEGKPCGSYQCVSPLGEGTTSTCFVVRNVKTLELCVLKVPKSNATQYTVTEAYYTALLDHFNIIMHHETFIHDGQLIVAMELCAVRATHQ